MGWFRQNKRKHWHLSGYIVPEATKPKSILKSKIHMSRIAALLKQCRCICGAVINDDAPLGACDRCLSDLDNF